MMNEGTRMLANQRRRYAAPENRGMKRLSTTARQLPSPKSISNRLSSVTPVSLTHAYALKSRSKAKGEKIPKEPK